MYTHERVTLSVVAEAIADLKGAKFAGPYDNAKSYSGNVFFVPDDTLMPEEASCLGICLPTDLFGAVVPYPFAKTKAITHRLVDPSADRPEGWSSAFSEMVEHVVLPGYTVFSVDDARAAAARLLNSGAIRIKEPLAAGGVGHTVATTIDEFEAFLDAFPEASIAAHGLVVESNLRDVTTVSIGQITIDDMTITYHGKQRVATNNAGCRVYGGSALVCVRGGWEALARLPMPRTVRLAAAQAKVYEGAMCEYPGFMVSRRNYDVAQGLDGTGCRRSGVLEASWRSGGASTAELAALREFAQDPSLHVVEASTVKLFGRAHEAPPNAVVHYRGDDPEDGPIARYTMVTRKLKRYDSDCYRRHAARLETTLAF
ncbi:MAG: DUF3182 family protein [Bradyrhizobiaceae bacterium]|nr:DUF3182 family protein [Bradyrhizobiaceae bacterium]